jgi:cell division septal protein FtsQ
MDDFNEYVRVLRVLEEDMSREKSVRRGFMWAIPLAIVLWAAIAGGVIGLLLVYHVI